MKFSFLLNTLYHIILLECKLLLWLWADIIVQILAASFLRWNQKYVIFKKIGALWIKNLVLLLFVRSNFVSFINHKYMDFFSFLDKLLILYQWQFYFIERLDPTKISENDNLVIADLYIAFQTLSLKRFENFVHRFLINNLLVDI